jgi:hypothetical protein
MLFLFVKNKEMIFISSGGLPPWNPDSGAAADGDVRRRRWKTPFFFTCFLVTTKKAPNFF